MKIFVPILVLFVFFTLNSKAQSNFIDSTKNEIGININPLLPAFGISTNSDNMTLQFKHHFTNVSLRIGATGNNTDTYNETNLQNYHYRFNDSTTVIDHYYNINNSVRVNIGLEQQQTLKNKWKFFYGFDILGGYTNQENHFERNIYILGSDSSFTPYHTAKDSTISSVDHILVGAAFVAGFDYFFSKRISAGIQGYFPITYEFQTGNIKNKTSSLSFDQKFSILVKMHF